MINGLKNDIDIRQVLKFILAVVAVITLVILIVGVIVSKAPVKFALGLLLGSLVSVIRLLMLARAVGKAVDMEPADSKLYMVGQYNIRMLLAIAAVVACGIMKAHISIIGMILGLVAAQPAVYIANFIYEKKGGKKFGTIDAEKTDRNS